MADTSVRLICQFKSRHLHAEVRCPKCGWSVVFPAEGMSWLFEPLASMDAAKARLRCRRCGQRGAEITPVRSGYR